MIMRLKGFVFFAVLIMGVNGCQDRIIVDQQVPFGAKVTRLGDVEVAAVDGTSIYLSDVEQMARAKGALAETQKLDIKSALFETTLKELVDQRVLALAAVTETLDQTETAKRRRAAVLEQLYGRLVIENELKKHVTDAAIKRLYEAQRTLNNRGPERRARLILVASQEEADAVLKRLDDGEDFGVLAGILSIDEATQNKNGDLGYFSRDMLADAVAKAAFETDINRLAPVFETEDGFHILEVTGQRKAPQPSFEDMEPELREFLTFETINNKITALREGSDIRLNVATSIDRPQISQAVPPEELPQNIDADIKSSETEQD